VASVRVRLRVLVGLKGDDEFLARARVLERRGRIRVMLMRLFLRLERWLYFFVKVSGEKTCVSAGASRSW
jgi:hypothetical protein